MAEHLSKSSSPESPQTRPPALVSLSGGFLLSAGYWFLAMSVMPFASKLHAGPPTLEYLFPGGGLKGTSLSVSVGGKIDSWPVKAWADCDGISFIAETNKN